MGVVLVDGKPVEVGDKERLNGIQAAARAGVEVPHYCWHPGLSVVASCRMCLVGTGTRNAETGKISMLENDVRDPKTGERKKVLKLVPACQTPARDGTVFVTDDPAVRHARAFVEEALLIDHPVDCPICDKAGECLLQDYHFEHGQKERRADVAPFHSRRREMGETVALFVDRCVMCSRCVRFTREISGTSELMIVDRGSHEEIDVLPGFPLDNKLSGNVVDLCPVGALGDKDFLYQQRVWFLKKHDGVCAGCSTGCSIRVEENQDRVWRLKPRENPFINQWWMCDEGRYGFHHVHDERRLASPRRRDGEKYVDLDWSAVPAELNARLSSAGRLAALVSPHLTVEEAWLLATYLRKLDPQALLAIGPVPIVGEDEGYPSGFTIRAEKCPNRRGVTAVIKHFMGRAPSMDDVLAAIDAGEVRGVWASGGYKTDWIDEATAARFESLAVLVVQDLFESPLSRRATHLLPGGAFAEREGSYVNFADRLQSFKLAIRPPAGVWVEGPLYWRMLERTGLYRARRVLDEIAAETLHFSAAAGEIPPTGVDLRVNLLADGAAAGAPSLAGKDA